MSAAPVRRGAANCRRTGIAVLVSIAIGLIAAAPVAASEPSHGSNWSGFIWQILNFGALVAVLVYVARQPIRSFFSERRDKIVSEIGTASDLLKRSELRFSEWQRKLVDLDARLEEIRQESRERAQEERESILADARQAADRIRRDASAAVEQELRRARRELRAEASDLAVEIAADLLRESVGESDRERLLDEFIDRIESPADGAGTVE